MLAVRLEKALPLLDRYAPVIALAMAAPALGMTRPCASRLVPSGAAGMRAVAAAPGMAKTARTLPTRSVTAMVAAAPLARASAAAWAMIVPTSAPERLSAAGTENT